MADDKSEDVDFEGEEDGSIISGSEETATASGISVHQGDPSQASVQQPEKSEAAVPELSPATNADPSEASAAGPAADKSRTSIKQAEASELSMDKAEQSELSIQMPEKSVLAVASRQDLDDLPDLEAPLDLAASIFGDEPAEISTGQPGPEPEPPRYVEPLGQATETSLLEYELKPWILDKLYHDGRMGRYGTARAGGDLKLEEGGSTKYEGSKWTLEKMFRQVPEEMSLGKVRLKPDELLYEEEKWVLGKMFRDLREEDYGYMPIAQKQESLIDIRDAIEIFPSQFPPEPRPCKPPPQITESSMDTALQSNGGQQQPCGSKVVSPTGKVFEFSYGGVMAVSVDSTLQVDSTPAGGGGNSASTTSNLQRPVTPFDASQGTNSPQELLSSASGYQGEFTSDNNKLLAQGSVAMNTCGRGNDSVAVISKKNDNTSDRTCRNKLRCENHIQAVCDAARKAMAIYDTVTGCDNFPCNEGDRPDKEVDNIEDSVWSWLYQLIFKLTPVDTNRNPLVPVQKEPSVDEYQRSGGR